MQRLAIVTTHPIQYYAPLFALLAQRRQIEIKVFYTWGQAAGKIHDPGFGRDVEWDLPLLDGYDYDFIENIAIDPGSHHRRGIINPDLCRMINNWRPDAVLIFGWLYQSHLALMRRFKHQLPVLFRGDSTLLDERAGIKSILRYFFLRWVYHHVDFCLYPGSNTKAYFKKYGLREDQLIYAPHAIDNDRFDVNGTAASTALRLVLGIDNDDLVILYAGKFESKKDPMLLLSAFIQLAKPNCHLIMAGNGQLEAALKIRAAGYPAIHFLDFQNQSGMPALYQACDLFCLPSRGPNETWGLAVNEAMASGKAVLVSDKTGCAADLIENDQNGRIFESGKEADLLRCLDELTSSKTELLRLGRNGKKKITDWSFTKIAEAIERTVQMEHIKKDERK